MTDLLVDVLATARLTRAWVKDSADFPPLKPVHGAAVRALDGTDWDLLTSCPWCTSLWFGLAVRLLRRRGGRAGAVLLFALAASQVTGVLADIETEREEQANAWKRMRLAAVQTSSGGGG